MMTVRAAARDVTAGANAARLLETVWLRLYSQEKVLVHRAQPTVYMSSVTNRTGHARTTHTVQHKSPHSAPNRSHVSAGACLGSPSARCAPDRDIACFLFQLRHLSLILVAAVGRAPCTYDTAGAYLDSQPQPYHTCM